MEGPILTWSMKKRKGKVVFLKNYAYNMRYSSFQKMSDTDDPVKILKA